MPARLKTNVQSMAIVKGEQNPTHPTCSFPVHGNRRFVSPLIYEKPSIGFM